MRFGQGVITPVLPSQCSVAETAVILDSRFGWYTPSVSTLGLTTFQLVPPQWLEGGVRNNPQMSYFQVFRFQFDAAGVLRLVERS